MRADDPQLPTFSKSYRSSLPSRSQPETTGSTTQAPLRRQSFRAERHRPREREQTLARLEGHLDRRRPLRTTRSRQHPLHHRPRILRRSTHPRLPVCPSFAARGGWNNTDTHGPYPCHKAENAEREPVARTSRRTQTSTQAESRRTRVRTHDV